MPIDPTGIANTAFGAGMGLVLQGGQDRRQLKQQGKLQALQIEGQKQMTDYNKSKQLELWKDTSYGPQKEQMQKAGLNPGLMYGLSGGGGATAALAQGSTGGGQAPTGANEIMGMMNTQMAMQQLQLLKAQKENIQADTANKQATTDKTVGVDTENVKADTENKILNSVILKYTGQEAKDQYTEVKSPNREIEAKTYMNEMEARQGVAGTIYELWLEGKLYDKGVNEIQNIALQGAKTSQEIEKINGDIRLLGENIKGAQLENIMKELESRLQTETGIDRASPAWMKVLGRLFVQLIGR